MLIKFTNSFMLASSFIMLILSNNSHQQEQVRHLAGELQPAARARQRALPDGRPAAAADDRRHAREAAAPLHRAAAESAGDRGLLSSAAERAKARGAMSIQSRPESHRTCTATGLHLAVPLAGSH